MIQSEVAIDKAVEYLKNIKPSLLGAVPENIRLETVQLFGKEWVVVLSYTTQLQRGDESLTNKFLEALSYRRHVKEFEVDTETGRVLAMRNPQSPTTTNEPLTAAR